MKKGYEPKTALTPEEKLKAAYFHDIRGIEQYVLADLFSVNSGRVADAISDIRRVVGWPGSQPDFPG
jgi:hypothetical protein